MGSQLRKYAERGDLDGLRGLIDSGVYIDDVDGSGNSSLFYAVLRNRVECVDLLIDRGANVNLTGAYGYSPLYVAATRGFIPILDALLCANATTDQRPLSDETNLRGGTALWVARRNKLNDVVERLEAAGALDAEPEMHGW